MSGKRGRPRGSRNVKETADVTPSRCPKCGSSRRTAYAGGVRQEFNGAGLAIVALTLYRTRCEDCGQVRIDRVPEYGPLLPVTANNNEV